MSRTIHHQSTIPSISRSVLPPLWRNPFLLPNLTFLPTLLCGLCAIVGWIAPSWVETMLPGYHTRYLPVILFIVSFALIRSVYRLLRSIVGMLFFGAATLAIVFTIFPALSSYTPTGALGTKRSMPLPNHIKDFRGIPEVSSLGRSRPDNTGGYRSLPSPLPDDAYFPKSRSGGDTAEPFSAAHVSKGIAYIKDSFLKR